MAKRKIQSDVLIYQLRITLQDTNPPVWRTLQVRQNITLAKLHDYIQGVMGWYDSHLHEFTIDEELYGVHDPEDEFYDVVRKNERKSRLNELVGEGCVFEYTYDFGDNWQHEIKVEKILPPEPSVFYPRCIAGERACPPEDCGGTWGYEDFLKAIADPNHEEHDEYLEWVGSSFDPEAFDLKHINNILDNIRSHLRDK
jgi:hypothetical protein